MGSLFSAQPLEKSPEIQWFNELKDTLPRMDGKTVAITGCTSGTGFVLAQTCAELGAHVVMLNRPSDRANVALEKLKEKGFSVNFIPCDLNDFDSVRRAGAELHGSCESGIDVLCNNAGLMGLPDEASVDGCDIQMQANHLSHFLLTLEIWPLLEKAGQSRGEARVVNHSSGARKAPWKPITADYLQRKGGNLGGDGWPGKQKWQRYQQSKLANILFTYALQAHAEKHGSKVKSLCAHPGPTFSGLQQKTTAAGGQTMLDNYILNGVYKNCHATEDGAMGIVRCCCEASVESGQFYGPAVPGNPGPAELLPDEREALGGEDAQKLLWEESVKTTAAKVF